MKRSRLIIVGFLALGLAGSLSGAANASDPRTPSDPAIGADCPIATKVAVKGMVLKLKNGKVVTKGDVDELPPIPAPADGDKGKGLKVHIYEGAGEPPAPAELHKGAGEPHSAPADVELEKGTFEDGSGPVFKSHPKDGEGPIIACLAEPKSDK